MQPINEFVDNTIQFFSIPTKVYAVSYNSETLYFDSIATDNFNKIEDDYYLIDQGFGIPYTHGNEYIAQKFGELYTYIDNISVHNYKIVKKETVDEDIPDGFEPILWEVVETTDEEKLAEAEDIKSKIVEIKPVPDRLSLIEEKANNANDTATVALDAVTEVYEGNITTQENSTTAIDAITELYEVISVLTDEINRLKSANNKEVK